MPVNDDLGTRMKEFYENRAKTYLIRRTPVAVRVRWKGVSYVYKVFKTSI